LGEVYLGRSDESTHVVKWSKVEWRS